MTTFIIIVIKVEPFVRKVDPFVIKVDPFVRKVAPIEILYIFYG